MNPPEEKIGKFAERQPAAAAGQGAGRHDLPPVGGRTMSGRTILPTALLGGVVLAVGATLMLRGATPGSAAEGPAPGAPAAWNSAAPSTHADASSTPAEAAAAFLALLDGSAREKAVYPLDDPERFDWHFVPRRRNGLPLSEMTLEQRTAAHALLQATTSAQGYLKANAVIELERILGIIEGRPGRRDPEDYYVTVFGMPSPDNAWAWRFEGHHLSLNFSSPANSLTVTGPAFMGADPATVPSGPKAGWRPLGREEDLARALVTSLSAEQRATAVVAAEAPRDIVTGSDREARLDSFEGLAASEMTDDQREMLFLLLNEYVGNMAPAAARAWTTRIRHETPSGDLYFAWAGPTEPGHGHYYRIHSRTFLVEYDNTQNDANHVHSVWRDLENDFGGDALARHYEGGGHPH